MTGHAAVAPEDRSELEDALLALVREILRNDTIGREDDFFLAGGHSLLATQLVVRLRRSFGVKVTLHDLFEAGTAARLAETMEERMLDEMGTPDPAGDAGLRRE